MARPRKHPIEPTQPGRKGKVSLLDKYKDFAGIKVLERRFDHPDLPGSLPIRLKDEPTQVEDPQGAQRRWYLRWVNGAIDGRFSQATDGLGYIAVRVDELQNEQAISGLHHAGDGVVRRGDK